MYHITIAFTINDNAKIPYHIEIEVDPDDVRIPKSAEIIPDGIRWTSKNREDYEWHLVTHSHEQMQDFAIHGIELIP